MPRNPLAERCPGCDEELDRTDVSTPRTSRKAMGLYVLAVGVSAIWGTILFLWSPAFLVPSSLKRLLACAVFYLGPGLIVAMAASAVPKVRDVQCSRCRWSGTQRRGHYGWTAEP